jgi:dihydrofolate reductase
VRRGFGRVGGDGCITSSAISDAAPVRRKEGAVAKARRAAGDKKVLVHGAATAQLALAAGLLDELEIHLIPVLLGQGCRLFDERGPEHIELERTRVLEGDGVTQLHYRVQR